MNKEDLARQVRAWRGSVPRWMAADTLGIPIRTLERIEYGMGFRYPGLLMQFIATVPVDAVAWSDEDHARMAAWMRQEGLLK